MTRLIAQLLSSDLYGAEIWDHGQAVSVLPQEHIHVAQSGKKRRREFALGRACAHTILDELGFGDAVIAKAHNGAPIWPAGLVGSITHTQGYAAALIAKETVFKGVGIDAEQANAISRQLWPRLFTPQEQQFLEIQSEPLLYATILFCAKEASYKAWRMGGTIGFHAIEISARDGGFAAVQAHRNLCGRYIVQQDIVLVAALWRD